MGPVNLNLVVLWERVFVRRFIFGGGTNLRVFESHTASVIVRIYPQRLDYGKLYDGVHSFTELLY